MSSQASSIPASSTPVSSRHDALFLSVTCSLATYVLTLLLSFFSSLPPPIFFLETHTLCVTLSKPWSDFHSTLEVDWGPGRPRCVVRGVYVRSHWGENPSDETLICCWCVISCCCSRTSLFPPTVDSCRMKHTCWFSGCLIRFSHEMSFWL